MLTPENRARLLAFQRNEITEHHVYRRLAARQPSPANRRVLERIADDERRHYDHWQAFSGAAVAPNRWQVWRFVWLARLLGLTFAVKLMERGEAGAAEVYRRLPPELDGAAIAREEASHEQELLGWLDEERLRYVGSIVLGLNDALVELTGALAGLTLALQNTQLIALTGSITGIAAAFSMASSEYLSTKTGGGPQSPLKSALYTGAAYIVTVLALILPFLLLADYYAALACTLAAAVAIIAGFNYYLAVARDQSFFRRFAEMAGLSLGVAGLSFLAGWALRIFLGVEV